MQIQVTRKRVGVFSTIITLFLIGFLLGSTFAQVPAGTPQSFSRGVYPNASSYTIWIDGSYYYCKDAYGSPASWSGKTNASYVLQNCVDNLPYLSGGGEIKLLKGTYILDSAIILHPNLWIHGEHRMSVTLNSTGHKAFVSQGNSTIFNWGIHISDLTFIGNGTYSAIDFQYTTSNILLDNLQIKNFSDGIYLLESYAIQIQNSEVVYCTNNAIDVSGSHGTSITNCKIQYNLNGVISDDSSNLIISQCDIEANTQNGVVLRTFYGYTPDADVIRDCYFEANGKDIADRAIATIIQNNRFMNTITTPYAITLENDSALVTGNIFKNYTTADIWVVSTSSNSTVKNNRHLSGTLFITMDTPSTVKVNENVGYITEAIGTATINIGSTSVLVTHGLSYTPTLSDFSVTAGTSLGSANHYWVTFIDATTFQIYVNVDPSSVNATFGWSIRRG
jgi:parallel beta-helix repeat protein